MFIGCVHSFDDIQGVIRVKWGRPKSLNSSQSWRQRRMYAATQNQALCALVYLYKKVLEREPGEFQNLIWARKPKRLPVVLSPVEIASVLKRLSGVKRLIGCLLYGTGMRLTECLRIRVKDLDFD